MSLWLRVGALVLLLAGSVGAVTAKVRVDYDKNADFESYGTYAWKKTPDTSLDEDYPDVHLRIVRGVELHLTEGGLIEDVEDPDLWVTYHARTNSELRVDTTQMGYMYGNGWFWNPYWGGAPGAIPMTGTARTYRSGSFVLDIVDARTKEIVWRGTEEGKLSDDRDKLKRGIDTMLRRMVHKWQKIQKRGLK